MAKLRDERNVTFATSIRSLVFLRIVLRKNRVVGNQAFQLPNVRTVRSDPSVLDVHAREIDAAIAGAASLPSIYAKPVCFDYCLDRGFELFGEIASTKAETTVIAVAGVRDWSERRRESVVAVRGIDEPPVDLHCVEQAIAPCEQECELLDSRILYIGTDGVAEGLVELAEHDIEEVRRDAGALFEPSAESECSACYPRKVFPMPWLTRNPAIRFVVMLPNAFLMSTRKLLLLCR